MGGHHRVMEVPTEDAATEVAQRGSSTMPMQPGASGRHRAPAATAGLEWFNNLGSEDAAELLGACLDIPEWVERLAAGRPYPSVEALRANGTIAAAAIGWEQVAGALDRHPRIGEKAAATAGTGTESAWSSSEQGGVAAAHATALADGNRAYEQRFGYIFLICAAGLSGEQILENLHRRLDNDPAAEQEVVIGELRKIAALRLAKAVAR